MNHQLKIFNSLTGEKEVFVPLHENNVGMYVCGPTVYSNVHLGNVRTFMSFDFVYRALKFLGYFLLLALQYDGFAVHVFAAVQLAVADLVAACVQLRQFELSALGNEEAAQRFGAVFGEQLGEYVG